MQINPLELELLISFINYPKDMDSFLEKTTLKVFSNEAKEAINLIQDLKTKNILNVHTFFESLSLNQKNSEYFQQLLTHSPTPNYLPLAEIFIHTYKMQQQQKIAQNLLEASAENTLLDLTLLHLELDISAKEFKTLATWNDEYAKKPKPQAYKTNIPFLDNCFSGGFELGQLMLVFGEPEAGKTMFSLQILENLSSYTKVCFFCFEFTINDYLKRRSNSNLVNPTSFFIINDGYDILEVAQNIKGMYKQGVRFFLIDSQMRLTTTKGRNTEEEESLKFSTLAKLCHSLNIFIILICQNSKSDKDNPLGSKKGGHEASIIIHIERVRLKKQDQNDDVAEYDPNCRIFKIKKNKQTGKHYKDKILFCREKLRFYEETERNREIEIVFEAQDIQKELNIPIV